MVDLFICFALKCERTNVFLTNWLSMCRDSDKKIFRLCYKHVIAMSSRKIKKLAQVICWNGSRLKFVLSRLPYFAD